MAFKDKDTFSILFNLYYPKLLVIAKSYVLDQDEAEEIVQSSFVKLWEVQKKITEDTNINSYLFAIVKNKCLDYLKHQKVKQKYQDSYKKDISQINYFALKEETASLLIENELQKEIQKAIDTLPTSCKKIFIESRYKGLKNKEIASNLGISIRTVENQLFKAVKKLKKKLSHHLNYLFF